jgi:inward rectifier potassium channel
MPQYGAMREDVPEGARPVRQPQGYTYWLIGEERAVLRDAYHTFLRAPWIVSVALIALGFLVVNLIFAVIYMLTGGVEHVNDGSFWDALVFSVQTLATIGYGVMNPQSDKANTVMIVEAIVGVIVIALSTGLVFAKFSRPTARVAFSSRAVIGRHDGQTVLMFRVGNRRSNIIVEAQLRVICALLTKTAEGRNFYKLHDLRLVRDRMAGMRRGWNVMHVIDETSPLHGLDSAGLAARECELEISLIGFDDVTMQTVHSIHQYTDKQMVFDHRFRDMMRPLPDGDLVIDLRNFDAIERDSVPAS